MRKHIAGGGDPAQYYDVARNLISDPDNNCRWQAVIVVGESLARNPAGVWLVIAEHGDAPDEDMRTAIATCLLEHILEERFEEYFPRIKAEVTRGRVGFLDTLDRCWFSGPGYEKLQRYLRTARRGRPRLEPTS